MPFVQIVFYVFNKFSCVGNLLFNIVFSDDKEIIVVAAGADINKNIYIVVVVIIAACVRAAEICVTNLVTEDLSAQ